MNPLKIYNYFAARRPIVTTPVANIDPALQPFLCFAEDPVGFAKAIRQSLTDPLLSRPGYDEALAGIAWPSRAGRILDILDGWLERSGR
jgi:hypothetical protein